MAARSTGMSMLAAQSVQECHDMALIAHVAADLTSRALVHFYDGVVTATEHGEASHVSYGELRALNVALAPDQPVPVPYKDMVEAVDQVMYHLAPVLGRR